MRLILLPIRTAPRDGRYILLAGPSGYTTTPRRYDAGKWETQTPGEGFWRDHAGNWWSEGGPEPTHWADLPTTDQELNAAANGKKNG